MATLLNRIAYVSDAGGAGNTPLGPSINAAFGRASCGVANCYLFIGGDTYSTSASAASMLHYDAYFNQPNIVPARGIMTPGNHDNGSGNGNPLPDNAAWKAYNNTKGTLTKTNGAELGSAGEGIPNTDQFLDIGGLRWFFINTGAINSGNATPGWPVPHSGTMNASNARVSFLRNNWKAGLKNVMVYHHPRWSYWGNHHDNPNMQNIINECVGHCCLGLSGHDHNMQIFQPQLASGSYPGFTQIVAGLCGTSPYTGAAGSQTSQKSWVQWANISSGIGFFQIDVFDDGSLVGSMVNGAVTTGALMAATASTGNTGAATVTIQTGGSVVDTTPPGTATLVLSGATQGTATLTMTATDNVGVVGFDVYRALHGSTPVLVATSVASPYTDTGLTAGTQYDYQVKAVDGVGLR